MILTHTQCTKLLLQTVHTMHRRSRVYSPDTTKTCLSYLRRIVTLLLRASLHHSETPTHSLHPLSKVAAVFFSCSLDPDLIAVHGKQICLRQSGLPVQRIDMCRSLDIISFFNLDDSRPGKLFAQAVTNQVDGAACTFDSLPFSVRNLQKYEIVGCQCLSRC